MENSEDIGKLEASIEKLITSYNALKKEKEGLEAALSQKEQEVENLNKKIENLRGEKTLIHKRVSTLIDSIEKWEKSTTEVAEPKAPAGGSQPQIFNIGS